MGSLSALISVFIGGGIGSITRYLLGCFVNKNNVLMFPIHTLCANFIGCFVIGFLLSFSLAKVNFSQNIKLFITVGFCGGLTTFSTFSFEVVNLISTQHYRTAFLYALLSLIICFAATSLGIIIGGWFGRSS